MAIAGRDEDFDCGDSAYDRYYGDPRVRPNPNWGPLDRPTFYATAIYPGHLKGGLLTDEWARLLRAHGHPIPGVYAAGDTTASVMGRPIPDQAQRSARPAPLPTLACFTRCNS